MTGYLGLALALGAIGILCSLACYIYFRRSPDKLLGMKTAIEVLLLGPLFPVLRSSARRGGVANNREIWALVAMLALFVSAIVLSVVFGVGLARATFKAILQGLFRTHSQSRHQMC